jgi:hypothetical protein
MGVPTLEETRRRLLKVELEVARIEAWQRFHFRWLGFAVVTWMIWVGCTLWLAHWWPWLSWTSGLLGVWMDVSRRWEKRLARKTDEDPPVPPEWPWRRGEWARQEEAQAALAALEEL